MDLLKSVEYAALSIGTLSALCTAIGSITALPESWRKIALLIGADLASIIGVIRGVRPSVVAKSASSVTIYTVDEMGKISRTTENDTKPDAEKH